MDNSKIEWTDHTFNPWWGCMKVSAGCKNCYAEALDKRWDGGNWGPDSNRRPMGENYWKQPLKWDKAAAAGVRSKVFCASMADVFEGNPDTLPHLQRLFFLINQTPNLIWQLLTKRPENIMELVPSWWIKHGFPPNVWIGTSVENQAAADTRIPHLLKVPAAVRFLSCEPLIGPLDLREYMTLTDNNRWGTELSEKRGWGYDDWSGGFAGPGSNIYDPKSGIDWVIAGGESGHGARPAHPDWFRSLRDQCAAAGVPFFFKQGSKDWPDYKNYDAFPNDLKIRQFP